MAELEQTPLEQAIAAVQAGQRHTAKDLLTRLLRSEQNNVDIWLWMSAAVDTEKEQIFCLQKALKADPASVAAKRGLVVLGAMSPEEAALPAADGLESFRIKAPRPEKSGPSSVVWLYALGGVTVLVVLVGVVLLLMQFFGPRKPVAVIVTSVPPTVGPTLTAPPTVLAGQPRCTPPAAMSIGTPLSVYLCVTTTPTSNPISKEKTTREEFTTVQLAYFAGDWAKVIDSSPDAIKVAPNSAHLYFYIGEAYRHLPGKLSQAVQNYTVALSKDSNFAPAYWGRALANPANALDDFNKAIKADPTFVPAYLGLAQIYSGNGNAPQAVNTLEKARDVVPDNSEVAAFLALAYVDAGQPDAALTAAARALQLNGAQALAFFARGRAEYALGQFEAADQDLSLSQRYVSDLDVLYADIFQANVLYAYGLGKVAVGDDESALTAFNDALAARPSSPLLALYLSRGQLYLRQKNFEAAGADFNKIITLLQNSGDPLLVDAYLGNGQSWLGRNKADSALSNFQMAVRLAPDRFEANLYLGQTLMLSQQPGDALQPLSFALGQAQTDTQKAAVYTLRAEAFHTLGQVPQQVADLQALAALAKAPGGAAATAQAQLTQIGPLPTATATATLTPTMTLTPTIGATPTRTLKPSATLKTSATAKATITSTATRAATPTPALPTPTAATGNPPAVFTPTATKKP